MKAISVLLLSALLFNCSAALALTAVATRENGVTHLYIPEGVENVVLVCGRYDFQKEAGEFKGFREKYALLWAVIITTLVAFAGAK